MGRWQRWEERNPIISFPTDCYPPFLGILILSLRDMILFLLRGDLGAPWPTWAKGTSPKRPMRLGNPRGKSPQGVRHLRGSLGRMDSSPPLGRTPSLEEGARLRLPPLPCPYIREGREGQPHLKPWRLPPSRDTSSSPVGAWRSPAGLPRSSITTTPLCCCWMDSSSTSPSLLAGSRRGRHRRAVRVLNAEVPSVRH